MSFFFFKTIYNKEQKMSGKYNKKNTMEKEEEGRKKYLNWIASKPECQHICFTEERWCSFDCIFMSAGTQVICDIKDRTYNQDKLLEWGVEIDAGKAREVLKLSIKMNAMPVIITCTQDGNFIVSDLRLGKKEDTLWKYQRTNNNNQDKELKELINLKNCTIK